jgi:hypothetical protein
MRISALFALICTFALLVAVPAVAAQSEGTREVSPGVQPDPGYTTQPSATDQVSDTDLADGTSWAATIVAFLAGLGLGWVIFRKPAGSRYDMRDREDRAA